MQLLHRVGYKPDSSRWKVMAMSAYKKNYSIEIKKIKTLYKLQKDGKLLLDQKFFRINHRKLRRLSNY